MAPIEDAFGFREISYLYSTYIDAPETDGVRETAGAILSALPEKIRGNFPYPAEEKMRRILHESGKAASFDSYAVVGRLYVYFDINGTDGYKPVNRISFDTCICRILKEKYIRPADYLLFHVNVRGNDLSREEGSAAYLPGCSEDLWQMWIPLEKRQEAVTLERGMAYLEEVSQKNHSCRQKVALISD